MTLSLRGVAWLGLYLAIALLPLLVTALSRLSAGSQGLPLVQGLGIAAGTLALALMAVQFALVARLPAASRPFGSDALMYFHRLMGLAAAAFLLAHPVLLIASGWPAASLDPLAGPAASRAAAASFWLALLLVLLSVARRRLRLRYEWWQASHSLLAAAVVLGGAFHGMAAGSGRLAAWLLAAYAVGFLALLLHYRLWRPLALRRRPWRLIENRDEGASTRTLVLEPAGHDGLSFEPGQFAWLATGGSPFGFGQHPVSFSSSAMQLQRLEFSVKALGDWSSVQVPALEPGQPVYVDGPYGAFTPDRHAADGWLLIAGGVGITPMRSMLLTLRDRRDPRPVLLVHAAHDPGRAIFREEIDRLCGDMNLSIVRVYEAAAAGEGVEQGYVTQELLRRHLPSGIARWQCFVCGPAPMMNAVERALLDLGVPAGRIQSERFDLV